jgi:hypothetical protein
MLPTNVGVGTKAIAAADVVSPAWPTHLANDIGILAVEYEGGTNPPTPAGWTAFSDSPVAYGGGAMALFWRRAETASESAPTVGAGDNDHVVAGIVAFRRCYELGVPWNVKTSANAATSTSVVCPAVTTTVAECLVVYIAACSLDNDVARFSAHAAAGLANVAVFANDHNTNLGNGGGFSAWGGELAAAGTSGTGTSTLTATSTQALFTIALRPPEEPPTHARDLTDAVIDWTDPGVVWVDDMNSWVERYD